MPTATLPQTSAINYERLLGAMPGLYLVLSPELIILEATDAYLHATLTTREQLTGSYIFDAFPNNPAVPEANSVETLQHSFSQVISGKRTHIMPLQRYDIPRPADLGGGFEERYWLATNNPVLDQKGEVLYIIHQVTDVTMQQLAQREVQTNRERFDVLAQATNDIIWDWNLLSNDVWWNRGYQDVLGYNLNEVGSETWTTGLHPEDQERVMKGVTGVLEQGGKMWTDKFRYRRADGSYATVISRGFALRDDQGMAYRMIGSMLDVSNLLDNDPGQQDRYKYFPELLNELPDPAWTTDPHGTTTFLNNAWRRVTGMAPGTLKGVGEYIHPEDLVNLNQLWVQCRDLQKTLETEYRIKDQASGQYLWFKARAVPMLNEQGEIEQWFGTCSCIHEQKELQQKLQAREALLQQLMDLSPVHFAVFKGPEHRCEFISPDFKKLHGNRNIVGRTVAEAWPEMVVQGFKNILDSVFASGKPYHGREFPIFTDRYGNGHPQEYFFNFSYYPLTDAQNQVFGLVATATDVTAQVHARREAEVLSEKLASASFSLEETMELLPLMTWTATAEGDLTFFSSGWHTYTGARPEELLGQAWTRLIEPRQKKLVMAHWQQAIKAGKEFSLEMQLACGGDYNWILLKAQPIRNQAGQLTKWAGIVISIQPEKELLSQLAGAKDQFHFLANTIPQLVWTNRPDGYHDYFNQRWTEYTGTQPEENFGETAWPDLLHPNDRDQSLARWQHALETGEFYTAEHRLKGADGIYRWFLCQAMPMRNDAGKIKKWFGTCTLIEDHKQAEAVLLAKNEELQRINEDLDNFVYTASHDLKLPIQNMSRIFGELSRNADFHDPEADKLISLFQRSLDQIYGTINDLTEVVKVQKNLEETGEWVNFGRLCEEVEFSMQDLARNVRIQTDFSAAPSVWFSRANLKSILYNLLTNSLKYAAPDRNPEISITATPAGDYTLLTVTDNGLGIDLQKHGDKLFKMFRRFHNHVPGSGLGLYLLNRIVTAGGGYIKVESEVNKGTTFKVYLKHKQPKQLKTATTMLNQIMLLDDDETTNFLNVRLLKRMGVAREIKVLTNVEAALEYLRNQPAEATPDLILMDIKMPEMDGFEFLDEFENMRSQFQREPQVVMLTSSFSGPDLENLKKYGFIKKHYSKPLSEALVREMLTDLQLDRVN